MSALDTKALEAAIYEFNGRYKTDYSGVVINKDEAIGAAITAYLSSLPHVGVSEEMVEAAVEIARLHLEIDGDNNGPFIRFDSIDAAVRAILATRCSSQQEEAAPVGQQDAMRLATDLLLSITGQEGGLPRINWYLLRNRMADAFAKLLAASPVPADAGEPQAKPANVVEARVSLMARTIRQTLRDYGHNCADTSLPEYIANDVEGALRSALTPAPIPECYRPGDCDGSCTHPSPEASHA